MDDISKQIEQDQKAQRFQQNSLQDDFPPPSHQLYPNFNNYQDPQSINYQGHHHHHHPHQQEPSQTPIQEKGEVVEPAKTLESEIKQEQSNTEPKIFEFLVSKKGDLFAIQKRQTGSKTTEVHILSKESNYSKFRLQTGTGLHETDDTFTFALGPNDDLIAIKKEKTGSNSVELHILSASSNYQNFVLHTGTGLHESDGGFDFDVADNGDLFAIKKWKTGSNSTEVHALSASSGYKEFIIQTGTKLHETDNTWVFRLGDNKDLVGVKKLKTGSNSTEVHVLNEKDGYQSFKVQTGAQLHETDETFDFVVGENNDLYAIKKSKTGSNSTEVHILGAASNYQEFRFQSGTGLQETA